MATDTVSDLASYQQFALQQQQYNNDWSAKQAEITRNWQAEMSNSAHQREVADLKAAGLNPILAANSGASVPSGATGETDTSAAGNVGAILQQVLQAQSAREVAGMYNAATLQAATIAAQASMYSTDENNKTKREYPDTFEGAMVKAISDAQHNSGADKSWNPIVGSVGNLNYTRVFGTGILKKLDFKTRYQFLTFLQNRGFKTFRSAFDSGFHNFLKLYFDFVRSSRFMR